MSPEQIVPGPGGDRPTRGRWALVVFIALLGCDGPRDGQSPPEPDSAPADAAPRDADAERPPEADRAVVEPAADGGDPDRGLSADGGDRMGDAMADAGADVAPPDHAPEGPIDCTAVRACVDACEGNTDCEAFCPTREPHAVRSTYLELRACSRAQGCEQLPPDDQSACWAERCRDALDRCGLIAEMPRVDATCAEIDACATACGDDAACRVACAERGTVDDQSRYARLRACLEDRGCLDEGGGYSLACAHDGCASSLAACLGPPLDCVQRRACTARCAGDAGCLDACRRRTPPDIAAAHDALQACIADRCPDEDRDCVNAACRSQIVGCYPGTSGCGGLFECRWRCDEDDAHCLEACVSLAYPPADEPERALSVCVREHDCVAADGSPDPRCYQRQCGDAFAACFGEYGALMCPGLYTCLEACAPGDSYETCTNTCRRRTPRPERDAWGRLDDCERERCADAELRRACLERECPVAWTECMGAGTPGDADCATLAACSHTCPRDDAACRVGCVADTQPEALDHYRQLRVCQLACHPDDSRCVSTHCQAQLSACFDGRWRSCGGYADCLEACRPSDAGCVDACGREALPGAPARFDALIGCRVRNGCFDDDGAVDEACDRSACGEARDACLGWSPPPPVGLAGGCAGLELSSCGPDCRLDAFRGCAEDRGCDGLPGDERSGCYGVCLVELQGCLDPREGGIITDCPAMDAITTTTCHPNDRGCVEAALTAQCPADFDGVCTDFRRCEIGDEACRERSVVECLVRQDLSWATRDASGGQTYGFRAEACRERIAVCPVGFAACSDVWSRCIGDCGFEDDECFEQCYSADDMVSPHTRSVLYDLHGSCDPRCGDSPYRSPAECEQRCEAAQSDCRAEIPDTCAEALGCALGCTGRDAFGWSDCALDCGSAMSRSLDQDTWEPLFWGLRSCVEHPDYFFEQPVNERLAICVVELDLDQLETCTGELPRVERPTDTVACPRWVECHQACERGDIPCHRGCLGDVTPDEWVSSVQPLYDCAAPTCSDAPGHLDAACAFAECPEHFVQCMGGACPAAGSCWLDCGPDDTACKQRCLERLRRDEGARCMLQCPSENFACWSSCYEQHGDSPATFWAGCVWRHGCVDASGAIFQACMWRYCPLDSQSCLAPLSWPDAPVGQARLDCPELDACHRRCVTHPCHVECAVQADYDTRRTLERLDECLVENNCRGLPDGSARRCAEQYCARHHRDCFGDLEPEPEPCSALNGCLSSCLGEDDVCATGCVEQTDDAETAGALWTCARDADCVPGPSARIDLDCAMVACRDAVAACLRPPAEGDPGEPAP